MATLNKVINKQYHQSAGSFFPRLAQEDIQKLNEWLKRHNFYIEEKVFSQGGTMLSIGSKGEDGTFHQVIEPLTQAATAIDGQFTGKDLIEFIDAAGSKRLEGRAKKVMDRIVGIRPSAVESYAQDESMTYVLYKLKKSPNLETDYPTFLKALVDADHARNLEYIKQVNADPEKVGKLIERMDSNQRFMEDIRAEWENQRNNPEKTQEEEELQAS